MLPPRQVAGLGAAPISAADALRLSPAQVLALINTGWSAPGVSLQSQLSVQSLLDGKLDAATEKGFAQTKKATQVAGGILISTGVLAPVGALFEAYASVGEEVAKFFDQFTIDLSGPAQTCHPVLWPANFYYAKDPPTTASAEPIATLPPVAPIVPGTLRALLIPTLCQAFADVGDCRLLDPASLGSIAFMSNVWIASMVHAWNAGAIGPAADYYVPCIPNGPGVNNYWTGWASGGVHTQGYRPWGWPPPFIVPGQGQYAFEPLSRVPSSMADPASEYTQKPDYTWAPGYGPTPGCPWSRIRANTPPFLNGIQKTAAVSGIAAAGVGIYAAATGQSFMGALKSIYTGATRWL